MPSGKSQMNIDLKVCLEISEKCEVHFNDNDESCTITSVLFRGEEIIDLLGDAYLHELESAIDELETPFERAVQKAEYDEER